MTITRTLAVALTTAALVAPAAHAAQDDPINAPGATAVDSASVRGPQAAPSPAPAEDDDTGLVAGVAVAAALAAVAAAAGLQRRRHTATT